MASSVNSRRLSSRLTYLLVLVQFLHVDVAADSYKKGGKCKKKVVSRFALGVRP